MNRQPTSQPTHVTGLTPCPVTRGAGFSRRAAMRLSVLGALACGGLWSPPAQAAGPVPVATREYKVKLAYIYNFTRYVRWPENAFRAGDAPFVIAVVGEDPFGASLDALQAKKRAAGRPIKVERYATPQQVGDAHVLFVADSVPTTSAQQLLRGKFGQRPLLVICEVDGMATGGAPVNFYLDNNGTIGFELNVDAISRRALHVDAKLLSIARVVRDGVPTP